MAFESLGHYCHRLPPHLTLSSLDMAQSREIEMEGKNKGMFGYSTVNQLLPGASDYLRLVVVFDIPFRML